MKCPKNSEAEEVIEVTIRAVEKDEKKGGGGGGKVKPVPPHLHNSVFGNIYSSDSKTVTTWKVGNHSSRDVDTYICDCQKPQGVLNLMNTRTAQYYANAVQSIISS
jgi:hypothetical protein